MKELKTQVFLSPRTGEFLSGKKSLKTATQADKKWIKSEIEKKIFEGALCANLLHVELDDFLIRAKLSMAN